MEFETDRKTIIKLATFGPISNNFILYRNNRIIGELFNQKRDLFYINFLSALKRLDEGDIDKIRYNISTDEYIEITKNNGQYIVIFEISRKINEDKLKQILNA